MAAPSRESHRPRVWERRKPLSGCLMAVPGWPVPLGTSICLAHEPALLGIAVPANGIKQRASTNPFRMVQTNYLCDSFKSIGRSLSRQSHRRSRKHFSSDGSQPCSFRADWLLVDGRASAGLARLAIDWQRSPFRQSHLYRPRSCSAARIPPTVSKEPIDGFPAYANTVMSMAPSSI